MIPRRTILPIIVILLCASLQARAQNLSVSTNAVDWANFGTANAELSAAVGRHWSVNVSARYNPWTFGKGPHCRQNRVRGAAAGARWWPWNVYSGSEREDSGRNTTEEESARHAPRRATPSARPSRPVTPSCSTPTSTWSSVPVSGEDGTGTRCTHVPPAERSRSRGAARSSSRLTFWSHLCSHSES